MIVNMALTVTVYDKTTDSEFRCTRTQWRKLHEPAGMILVADEDGNPIGKPAKRTTQPETTEE